jgi:hypothetical protein
VTKSYGVGIQPEAESASFLSGLLSALAEILIAHAASNDLRGPRTQLSPPLLSLLYPFGCFISSRHKDISFVMQGTLAAVCH